MEGFVLLDTGAWSLVPPLLALALALITKEVYSSLLIGIVSGLLIYQFSLAGVGAGLGQLHHLGKGDAQLFLHICLFITLRRLSIASIVSSAEIGRAHV